MPLKVNLAYQVKKLVGLISINYKIAPLEIREKFYFDNSEKIVFNNLLKKKVGVEGLMMISTCNRTEIYFEFENHVGEEKKFLHKKIVQETCSCTTRFSNAVFYEVGIFGNSRHVFQKLIQQFLRLFFGN